MRTISITKQVQLAATGKGTSVLSLEDANQLISLGEDNGLFLVSVEVYELRNNLQVPRVDLSLYNVCNEDDISGLAVQEKLKACRSAFDHMIVELKNESGVEFGLRIWLED